MSGLDVQTGVLAQIEEDLDAILELLRKPAEWGGVDHIEYASWTANNSYTYLHNGAFQGVLVINQGAAEIYVSFTPTGGSPSGGAARPGAITLEGHGYLTLPVRASTVDVGGVAAGSALIIPLEVAPPPSFGSSSQIDANGNLKASLYAPGGTAAIDNISLVLDGRGGPMGLAAAAFVALWNGAAWDRQRTPNVFKDINAVAVVAGTPVTVWTPAAGKKFRLMGWHLSLSVAGQILFVDNTAPAKFRTGALAAAVGQPAPPSLGNGYLAAAVNNVLLLDVSAAGNINGFVFGTEE